MKKRTLITICFALFSCLWYTTGFAGRIITVCAKFPESFKPNPLPSQRTYNVTPDNNNCNKLTFCALWSEPSTAGSKDLSCIMPDVILKCEKGWYSKDSKWYCGETTKSSS